MDATNEHAQIIEALESISGKEMTFDNFLSFMAEIIPNGYSREFTQDELNDGLDQRLLNLNSK